MFISVTSYVGSVGQSLNQFHDRAVMCCDDADVDAPHGARPPAGPAQTLPGQRHRHTTGADPSLSAMCMLPPNSHDLLEVAVEEWEVPYHADTGVYVV